jgi:outer membrane receptor protein involved in Fe transport
VQDEIFLSEHFRWNVGARIDRFDVLKKAVLSPRTSLLYKPRASQTVRLSFNRAFRAPSFVNSFFDISFLTQINLGPAGRFEFPTVAVGNTDLKEEGLTAYEAGYIGGFGPATVGAAAYVNRTRNMIQFTQTGNYTSSAPPRGWPLPPGELDRLVREGRGLPSQLTYMNFDRTSDRGVELSAELRITSAVSTFANYSWQSDPHPTGFDISELNLPPTHRVNAGSSFTRGQYFGSLTASFVDSAFWQDVLPGFQGPTGAYTLVDGGFGVHSSDRRMTVAIRIRNLLNTAVQQHVFGDVIRRMVVGEVRFEL